MNPRELRIGNSIRINGEVIPEIGYGVITDVAQKYKGLKNKYLDTLKFKPIVFTEDVLKACGFKYNYFEGYSYSFSDDKVNFTYIIGNDYVTFNDFKIHSLHHLQNIYYFLTGNELKIDFSKFE